MRFQSLPEIRIVLHSFCMLFCIWSAKPALAFHPPVDRQGPLTALIHGPATIDDSGEPRQVQVVLTNNGDQPLAGSLRLQGIDGWHCEPADVQFQVAGQSEATYAFEVVARGRTYAAHYPLHAYATFQWRGRQHTVHPILIMQVDGAEDTSRAVETKWQPFPIHEARRLSVWELPASRVVFKEFDGGVQNMPVGWTGSSEAHRGTVRSQSGMSVGGQVRDTIAIHPPWHGGRVGTAWIEYALTLPDVSPIRLRFETAVTPTGDGDGVTFRARVAPLDAPAGQAGEVVFERHSAAKSWEAGEADLSAFAGQEIRLQLESHPGPARNTAFDQSYWAEPTLIVGDPPDPAPFPPKGTDDSLALGELRIGSTRYAVHVWPGDRGLLDADIGFVGDDQQLFFRGFQVRAFGVRLDDAGSPGTLKNVGRERLEDGCRFVHRFDVAGGSFDLVGDLAIVDNSLRARFRLENEPPPAAWQMPRIEAVSADVFDRAATRVYAGHGNVLERPAAFRLSFDGHRLATSHVGFDFDGGPSLVQAIDLPPDALEVDPASRHYSLQATDDATLTFIPAPTVWQAAAHYRRAVGWQAAGGVRKLAGRFVFDLWGGDYGPSARELERAFRYGLTDAAVVWHNWQRWGYDYRLPEIYPPNPDKGTEAELRTLINTCREAGVLFALHDNYIDIYPDAQGFSYEKTVAFTGSGMPVKAWFNKGRNAQSYRYRADRVAPFLQDNLRTIRDQLSPTAYFIDVWSSIKPYDYWTSDGRFYDRRFTRDSWREHFTWIRDLLGEDAPQISESGHDQLIGWLDGAQTNHLRVGQPLPGDHGWSVWNIPCADAERIPWLDFAHHDRFILHGAGYSGRYQAGLDARLHGIYSDDYLATEMLTGHPAMVSRPFGRDVVRKYWLTQAVMRALALRSIEAVAFCDDDLHRQHVRWSGGGEIWVNRGATDWEAGGYCLPQYGFLAQIPVMDGLVTAAVCRREGLIVEQALSPDSLYVNGRRMAGDLLRIRPRVEEFQSLEGERLEFVIAWEVDDPIPAGYQPFIHFVNAEGEIAFQATYDPSRISRSGEGRFLLPATASVPETCRSGQQYELRVGLYPPGRNAPRLAILGRDDGERRIRLGSLTLAGDGQEISGVEWSPVCQQPDPYLARWNVDMRPVDFGCVTTSSACRLTRDADALILTPLPQEPANGTTWKLRWDQLPWPLQRPSHVAAMNEQGEVISQAELGERIEVQHQAGAFAYRFQRQ